jgi:hypothetical protein
LTDETLRWWRGHGQQGVRVIVPSSGQAVHRTDPEFRKRLTRIIEQDRELLERLAK